MNRVSVLLVMVLCLVTLHLNAQTKTEDYFVGKWDITIQGPEGDIKFSLAIERKDGKLTGVFAGKESASAFSAKITKVTESEQTITVSLDTEYGEVDMFMRKVDDDNIKGDIMGMLDVTGKRAAQ